VCVRACMLRGRLRQRRQQSQSPRNWTRKRQCSASDSSPCDDVSCDYWCRCRGAVPLAMMTTTVDKAVQLVVAQSAPGCLGVHFFRARTRRVLRVRVFRPRRSKLAVCAATQGGERSTHSSHERTYRLLARQHACLCGTPSTYTKAGDEFINGFIPVHVYVPVLQWEMRGRAPAHFFCSETNDFRSTPRPLVPVQVRRARMQNRSVTSRVGMQQQLFPITSISSVLD
jgi:hypothetical protein